MEQVNSPAGHAMRQADLYTRIWDSDPDYGTRAADVQDTVLHRIAPHIRRVIGAPVSTVIDFGAGDGRFLHELYREGLTFAGIGVDLHGPAALPQWMTWVRQPLWEPLDVSAPYAISTDTLEHMPPSMVAATLLRIREAAPHGFLRISNRQDIYGTDRGLHLHETVEPPEWWLEQMKLAGINPSSWRIYPNHATEVWY